MLIFNCTEAASKFFSRVHKGKTITPVDTKPPSSVIEDDELNGADEQWLVHAITVQRKHVLLVLHIKTRYCVILADAKKADVEGFVEWFKERWREGLIRDAINHDLMQWIDAGMMTDRIELSREHRFYRRGHRSAQKHIEQIAWFFEDCAAEWGCLPQGERAAIGFDAQMNSQIRNAKERKDYFRPDEEMLAHWLRQYCGVEKPGVQAALERRREAEREIETLEEGLRIN
ncbi:MULTISPECIES: DUF6933 domain-containing protein [Pseudomonas fluorescens group]|uniref:DUF6933 domain-containing protein n=1 Tax=Pseudomonas fluorescens group TaxID=136843 RepID=UPI00080E6650|nr:MULTISPECIES: hypothetical protein [Pseudomonas fluorescens group]MDR6160846.1 hypothetical protein [Pseudomonas fluorescens]UST62870.1 hypothetical protein NF673_19870 [Pseudomonas moraviensis]WPC29215.1 hypothetical protein OE648_05410 [Pseudomonas moraviensis]